MILIAEDRRFRPRPARPTSDARRFRAGHDLSRRWRRRFQLRLVRPVANGLIAAPQNVGDCVKVTRTNPGGLKANGVALGHEQEIAFAFKTFGAAVGDTRGIAGFVFAGDRAHQPYREVCLDGAADQARGRLLCARDQVNAGLTATLADARQHGINLCAAGLNEIGKLVDCHDDKGTIPAFAVAEFHFLHHLFEALYGLVGRAGDAETCVWQACQGSEPTLLRVDENELEIFWTVVHGERRQQGARERGLARSGGTGDENMGNVR